MRSSLTATDFSLQTVVPQVVNIFKQENSGCRLNQKRESWYRAKEHGNADHKPVSYTHLTLPTKA